MEENPYLNFNHLSAGYPQWARTQARNAQNALAVEAPKSRAFRLLAEAKKRHPEWEVKKFAKPLDKGEQV